MKNPYIIPAAMISAAILVAVWMLKPTPPPPSISIHDAACTGNIGAVKQHIVAGTDVNAKYLDRSVPLHLATMFGQKEVVKILIEEGGDVNAINADGHTPLDMAEDHPEVANLLRKHGGKHSIFAATSQGNIEAVKEHLADGSDVNAKDGVGRTPLDRAEEDFLDSSELKAAKKEIAALLRKHGGQQSVDVFDTGN